MHFKTVKGVKKGVKLEGSKIIQLLCVVSSLKWRACNAPGRIRTCNLRFRRPPLYPIELRVRQNIKDYMAAQ